MLHRHAYRQGATATTLDASRTYLLTQLTTIDEFSPVWQGIPVALRWIRIIWRLADRRVAGHQLVVVCSRRMLHSLSCISALESSEIKGLSHEVDSKNWQQFTELGLTRDAAGFKFLRGFRWFYYAKSLFLAYNASFRWLNNVSCLFLSFLLITSGV